MCLKAGQAVKQVAQQVGLPLAEDKFFGPSQVLDFLGLTIDSIGSGNTTGQSNQYLGRNSTSYGVKEMPCQGTASTSGPTELHHKGSAPWLPFL